MARRRTAMEDAMIASMVVMSDAASSGSSEVNHALDRATELCRSRLCAGHEGPIAELDLRLVNIELHRSGAIERPLFNVTHNANNGGPGLFFNFVLSRNLIFPLGSSPGQMVRAIQFADDDDTRCRARSSSVGSGLRGENSHRVEVVRRHAIVVTEYRSPSGQGLS